MALAHVPYDDARQIVSETLDKGVNYIDLPAPTIGGDIEVVLAGAIKGRRDSLFLAGRTARRDAAGAADELAEILRRLQTEYLDLYQFDAIADIQDLQQILAPDGAGKAMLNARACGQAKMVGFAAHDVEAGLALMESFPVDAILAPVNFVCFRQGNFGPQLLAAASKQRIARLGCDSLAYTPWPDGAARPYPSCPYRPIDVVQLARQAIRFALTEDVTAILAPPDAKLLDMAIECTKDITPLPPEQRQSLLESARGLDAIFSYQRTGAD